MGSIDLVDIEIIECIRKLFSITKQLPPISALYILKQIQASENISQKELAQALHIRPQSVSDHLKKMERDGYVQRSPSSTDKRISLVSITDAGRAKISEMEVCLNTYSMAFFMGFDIQEKETLNRHLRKMIASNRDLEPRYEDSVQ